MNELLGWYGYGNETAAKRNGIAALQKQKHQQQRSADDSQGRSAGSASGVASLPKTDPSPRNRQSRVATRVDDPKGRDQPRSLSNSPARMSPASNENNLGE